MPYKLIYETDGPDKGRWCCHKVAPDGSLGASVGCSDTEEKGKAHMAALYAAEDDATKSGKRLQAAKLEAARAAVMTLAELVKWAGYEDEPQDAEPDAEDASHDSAEDELGISETKSYLASIKSQTATTTTIAGYCPIWDTIDLDGEHFTKNTDLALDLVPHKPVFYDHTLDPDVADENLGTVLTTKADETGLWVEMQLDRAKRYARAVAHLVGKGALGISSGSIPHLVRKSAGEIKRWPIVEFSLTPVPSEHRTVGVRELKSLAAAYPELEALLFEPSEPAATQDSAIRNPPAIKTGASHQECAAMADNQTPAFDVADIARQVATEAVKAYRKQLDEEPALKTAGVNTIPAEVKAAGPLYTGLGEFLLDVAHAAGGGPSRKLAEVKSSDPLDEGGYSLTRAMGADFVGSLTNAKRGLAIKAPTGLNEGVGAQGGFLVGTDRPGTLMARVYDTAQVLSRVKMLPITTSANGLTLNAEDETSRADGYRRGGIQAYWLAEAGTKLSSLPKFRQMELKLKKIVGLAYATDELLSDAAQLETWIMDNLPEELRFKAEDSVFNGSGAGMPIGIMTSLALITVAKETGQAADTVVFDNVIKMYARMWTRSLPNSAWYISGDVWPQLYKMSLAVGTGGSAVYLPPGGLSAAPYGTLMGRPVLPIEYCAKLGDLGDIVFADLSTYQMIDKGGIQSASSIHVAFTTDQTCFRFVYRIDGQPTWNSPLTPKNGGDTVSPFVTLAAR